MFVGFNCDAWAVLIEDAAYMLLDVFCASWCGVADG